MVWSACVVETVTGKYLGPLDCTINSWARELNGTDTATVAMNPGALTTGTRDWIRNITTPWRMSLVIQWDGIPIFSGPIISRPWDGKQLTINAAGVETAIFGRRKAHSWVQPYATQVISYTNMSLGSIMQALFQLGTSGTKPGSSIPIVYPGTEVDSDPTHVRTYTGFELKNISDLIDELTNVINGPDRDLLPAWTDATATMLQYILRVGTLAQPKLMSPSQIVFDAAQPESSVKSLAVIEDGSLQATTQWAAGSGSDVGTLMSQTTSTGLTSLGWPLLEVETDYRTVADQSILDTHTAGDLATHTLLTNQWTLTVDALQPPAFGSYLLGDVARVRVANHVWIPDGDYPMRIIGMSGDASTSINLHVQAV